MGFTLESLEEFKQVPIPGPHSKVTTLIRVKLGGAGHQWFKNSRGDVNAQNHCWGAVLGCLGQPWSFRGNTTPFQLFRDSGLVLVSSPGWLIGTQKTCHPASLLELGFRKPLKLISGSSDQPFHCRIPPHFTDLCLHTALCRGNSATAWRSPQFTPCFCLHPNYAFTRTVIVHPVHKVNV